MSMIANRRDLDFLLYEVLGIDRLFAEQRYAAYDRESLEEMFNSAQTLAEEVFYPFATKLDANEPKFEAGKAIGIPEVKEALQALADAGLFGASFDEDAGGLQMPYVAQIAMNGMLSTANHSVYGYAMLTIAAANMLNTFGDQQQKDKFMPAMLEGRWFGTMCLSETQAGSSLSDIRTRAELRDDGAYNIVGSKMWISGGDQEISDNIVHMVLAKIPGGPPGVKGISLFIVPKYRVKDDGSVGDKNNVVLAGLNHKMGQRGLTNALLNFGDGGDSIGYLVGEPHDGLRYMFHMMNEARILVGHGATVLGLAAYLFSLDYARERLQGRHPLNKDPTSPQVPIIEHADVKRLLMAQKVYVEGSLSLVLYCGLLVDRLRTEQDADERTRLDLLLEILTPIVKSWPSEYCLEANKHAIQILGGYGYTRDYPVERHYRDNRLNQIHEGAHGIHGIDLLGRKVRMAGGRALDILIAEIDATISEAQDGGFATEAADLADAVALLRSTTADVLACDDTTLSLANATIYLDACGHIVVAWLWLQQALAAKRAVSGVAADAAFYNGKKTAMQFFMRYELPKVAAPLKLVGTLDDLTLNADAADFIGT